MSLVDRPISVSQIELFKKCPKQYYYRYHWSGRKSLPDKKTLPLILGSAVHKALEFFYRSHMAGVKIITIAPLEQEFTNALLQLIEQAGTSLEYKKKRKSYSSDDAYKTATDQELAQCHATGIKLVNLFLREYYASQARYKPIHVEHKMEFTFPDFGLPGLKDVSILGFIDLIDQDTLTGQTRIIDHKTSGDFDKSLIGTSLQLTLYNYYVSRYLKYDTKAVAYQLFNTRDPDLNWLYGSRDERYYLEMLKELNAIIPCMKNGPFYKRESDQACRFCNIATQCQALEEIKEPEPVA
jgi:ATP-dependent helicase/DNAse subunit B